MEFELISPVNCEELKQCLSSNQDKNIRLAAGFTDLIIELKKDNVVDLSVINLSKLREEEFAGILIKEEEIRIGSMVTAASIARNVFIRDHFPVLSEAADGLASKQIREVATIGGNICQASPSGDLSCALTALKAFCEIMNMKGQIRSEALPDFFRGPGKTSLGKNEVLRNIVIPSNKSKLIRSGFIKIGKRAAMECSIVSIAWHIQSDENGSVLHAGVACGAVAPTVILCMEATSFLIGKKFRSLPIRDKEHFATLVQHAASPIDDLRASAWYRKEVLYNIAISIFE